jgi:D-sedoheptulose 7-phosphate isomerase
VVVVSFSSEFLKETCQILEATDPARIEAVAEELAALRARGGRLFVLGVGGSAAHASHATGDFRKMCAIEAYAPTDNVAELTARTNDDGWAGTFAGWLRVSQIREGDGVLVFSVGGGNREKNVSPNLVEAIDLALERKAKVLGIVGRDGGYAAARAHACVIIPPLFPEHVTPHTEGLAAVVWHLIVTHPALHLNAYKWESVAQ